MRLYRKRPITIAAVRFTGDNYAAVQKLCIDPVYFRQVRPLDYSDPEIIAEVWDKLHSTWVGVRQGDWIIQGINRETYPCADDVFRATYEPVVGDLYGE